MTLAIILLATLLLAYANGANDVSRAVATLVGSGRASYRTGLAWGTLWTGVGGFAALLFGGAMVKTFTGWVNPDAALGGAFPVSVAVGAAAWVLFAERRGLPVSTSHALVGAVCGVAIAGYGVGSVAWAKIANTLFLPLLVSPLIGIAAAYVLFPATRRVFGATQAAEICLPNPVYRPALAFAGGPGGAGAASGCGPTDLCVPHPTTLAAAGARRMHWLSSGLVAFARAFNDTPKIAAFPIVFFALVPQTTLALPVVFAIVAGAMCVGSLLSGARVTQTMAEKITRLPEETALAANLVSSVLVATAARYGFPVSTTHVTNSAIIGAGICQGGTGAITWTTVRSMALAWVVTLPASAALGSAVFATTRSLLG
jgi:PiT family inorganic phosphate transporter